MSLSGTTYKRVRIGQQAVNDLTICYFIGAVDDQIASDKNHYTLLTSFASNKRMHFCTKQAV